jgi:uncharacterized protein YndB with AHSA1/START domain
MLKLTAELEIDRPTAEVWAVLGDYRRDPDWRAGVTDMSPSPAAPAEPGQTTVEQMRFGGRSYRNGGLIETVDPGRRLTWRTTSGVDAEGSRTVDEPAPGRCRIRLETTVRPHGADRLFSPVLGPLLRRRMEGDLRRLRTLVERAAATRTGPGR